MGREGGREGRGREREGEGRREGGTEGQREGGREGVYFATHAIKLFISFLLTVMTYHGLVFIASGREC